MSIEIDSTGSGLRLRPPAELTLVAAVELQPLLLNALEAGTPVTLDLEPVEEIDLASLQLVFAAQRTFAGQRTELRIEDPSGVLARFAAEVGAESGRGGGQ